MAYQVGVPQNLNQIFGKSTLNPQSAPKAVSGALNPNLVTPSTLGSQVPQPMNNPFGPGVGAQPVAGTPSAQPVGQPQPQPDPATDPWLATQTGPAPAPMHQVNPWAVLTQQFRQAHPGFQGGLHMDQTASQWDASHPMTAPAISPGIVPRG